MNAVIKVLPLPRCNHYLLRPLLSTAAATAAEQLIARQDDFMFQYRDHYHDIQSANVRSFDPVS